MNGSMSLGENNSCTGLASQTLPPYYYCAHAAVDLLAYVQKEEEERRAGEKGSGENRQVFRIPA